VDLPQTIGLSITEPLGNYTEDQMDFGGPHPASIIHIDIVVTYTVIKIIQVAVRHFGFLRRACLALVTSRRLRRTWLWITSLLPWKISRRRLRRPMMSFETGEASPGQ
jgi:hypothetical protein